MFEMFPATLQELPFLVESQMKMAEESEGKVLDPLILENGLKSVLSDPHLGCYYVATWQDELVGCLMVTYEWSDWRNGLVWWIQSVYVWPKVRRTGLYRQMYQYLKNQVECSNEIKGIRLYVDKSNEKAKKTYENLGMNGEHYAVYEWMKES